RESNKRSANDRWELYTTYPGLLIGSGYQHESGGENEFKIGFFFDYTTGLPQIPGSSVKGVLRSSFPGRDKANLQASKAAFITGLIEEVSQITPDAQQVVDLEMEIFEGGDFS